MNLAHWLKRAARVHPQRAALLQGDQVVTTYAELAERVSRLAGHLRHSLGLAPGERIALCMGNEPAYLEVMHAALWAGLAVVPVNAKLHPKEVAYILGDSGASVLFVSPALAGPLLAAHEGLPALRDILVTGSGEFDATFAAAPNSVEGATPTTWPGCSTPRAPLVDPRA